MPEKDPHELADELEAQADELSEHSSEIQQRVEEAHQDWEAKRADEGVPGAPPPPESESPGEAD